MPDFFDVSTVSRMGHQKEAIFGDFSELFDPKNPSMTVFRTNQLNWFPINIFYTKNGFLVICASRKNQSLIMSRFVEFACPQL